MFISRSLLPLLLRGSFNGSYSSEYREEALGLCIYPIYVGVFFFQKVARVTTLGPSLKLNTLLGVHSRKPGQKEIRKRRHISSVAFPVNVAGNCIGETGRPLAVRLREHRHDLQLDLLQKSKLAQLAYEEGHRVGWDEAMILEIESNSRSRI
jgi:hypothetical protein